MFSRFEAFSRLIFYSFSALADQLIQQIGGLLLHVVVAVAVNLQGEGDGGMTQGFGQRLGIDMALQGQGGIGVP